MPASLRIALVVVGLALAACRSKVDAERQLFERSGVQAVCEPQAVRVEALEKQPAFSLPGARRERDPALATVVTCRYQAAERELTLDFRVPYEWDREVRLLREQQQLVRDLAAAQGEGGVAQGQKLRRAYEQQLRDLMTVTYLPDDPRRAVLGPLDRWFQ